MKKGRMVGNKGRKREREKMIKRRRKIIRRTKMRKIEMRKIEMRKKERKNEFHFLFIYSECHLTLSNNIIVHRVVVNSENLAETTFAGPGAGRFPTANSVMNDLIR